MKEKIKFLLSDYFLEIIILCIAIILIIFNPDKAIAGLVQAVNNYKNLLLIIMSVALLTGFISEAVSKEKFKKLIGKESGIKGVLIGAIFGTLMVGPSYTFYPFFKEMINKGAKLNVVATAIGSWAIKLQWLPFAIALLGTKFIIIFNIFIFIYAIISGFVVEYFVNKSSKIKI